MAKIVMTVKEAKAAAKASKAKALAVKQPARKVAAKTPAKPAKPASKAQTAAVALPPGKRVRVNLTSRGCPGWWHGAVMNTTPTGRVRIDFDHGDKLLVALDEVRYR